MSLVTSEAEAGIRGQRRKSIPASLYAVAAGKVRVYRRFAQGHRHDPSGRPSRYPTGDSRAPKWSKDKAALKKLASILKHAKKTNLGNCPYTGVLTMVMKDGRVW